MEVARRASLVQEVWIGTEPRLRGRRLSPFEKPPVRLLFHTDLGATLDDLAVADFLERLGERLDVVAFEPRGQGGSGGRLGPEAVEDLRRLLEAAGRRWPDGLPLVLGGHGLGGALALSLASHPDVCGVAALAPHLSPTSPPEAQAALERLEIPRRVREATVPLLLVAPRADAEAGQEALAALSALNPRAAFASIPGDRLAPLATPWGEVVAEWARWTAAAR